MKKVRLSPKQKSTNTITKFKLLILTTVLLLGISSIGYTLSGVLSLSWIDSCYEANYTHDQGTSAFVCDQVNIAIATLATILIFVLLVRWIETGGINFLSTRKLLIISITFFVLWLLYGLTWDYYPGTLEGGTLKNTLYVIGSYASGIMIPLIASLWVLKSDKRKK